MRFTESHEWIRQEGNIGTVGITDYAQRELGEIVHVGLPKVGKVVKAGEEICVLESTKAAVDIYAPVSGKVVAVNEGLSKTPSPINIAAESQGWLFQIEMSHPKEIERLLSRTDYQVIISS